MRARRTARGVVAAGTALLIGIALALPVGGAAAAPGGAPRSAPAPGAPPVSVTLVTGDRVRLGAPTATSHGYPSVSIDPAARPGRTPAFGTRYAGGHVYVVPDDVADLVPGVLDEGLFDVTGLVSMGYDDGSRSGLPLIVQQAPGVRALAVPSTLRAGVRLASIHGAAATLDRGNATAFGALLAGVQRTAVAQRRAVSPRTTGTRLGGIGRIWLDRPVTAMDLDANLTQIGAPAAWQAGLSGAGVTVAVLDTGIDADHPDLAGQVTGQADFTGTSSDGDADPPTDTDDNGHGTHVASLIAGTGAAAGGARRGVAYGARLLAGKVLDARARGQASWLIAGMQWAVAQGSTVVNISVGGTYAGPGDPVAAALDALSTSSNALFVVAAGNSGPYSGTIESPGAAASALTVGAVGATNAPTYFTSRGPTYHDYRLKPDITAPGENIVGARAGARSGDPYTTMSGTSQATPQVAGAVTLLRAAHPDWSPQRVKTTLVGTGTPSDAGTVWDQGGGRLDLARAITNTLTANASEVDYGNVRWPHQSPVDRQLTLTNTGATDVTVDLAAAITDRAGNAAPAGLLTVGPGTITVPAGGSASTTVTLHPEAAPVGQYGGALAATAGGTTLLRLPVNAFIESERYDVHLTVLDAHGDPYAGGSVAMINGDNGNANSYYNIVLDADGRATVRVAPGYFGVQSRVETPAPDGSAESISFAGDPEVHVDGDTSLVIDARKALPVRAPRVPHVRTTAEYVGVLTARLDDHHGGNTDTIFPTVDDVTAGRVRMQPTSGPVTHGRFQFMTRWRLLPTDPGRNGAPGLYDLVLPESVVADPPVPDLTARDVRDLARLDVTYHAVGQRTTTYEARYGGTDLILLVGAYRPVDLPTHRVELVSAGPDIRWAQLVETPGAGPPVSFTEPDTTYRPGQRVRTDWLRALHPQAAEAPRYPTYQWFTTGLSDGTHTAKLQGGDVDSARMRMWMNGTPLGERTTEAEVFPVPNEAGHFVVEQDLTVNAGAVPPGGTSHTRWTFDSAPVAGQSSMDPAVIRLDYLPGTDDTGYARAGRALRIDVVASHLDGSTPPPGGFRDVHLWYSPDNGTTWHRVALVRRASGRYAGVIPGSGLRGHGPVAVRAAATDAAGATIDQTTTSLFAVR